MKLHAIMTTINMSVEIDLNGKVALVTGSARGIGLAIAKALAEAGADVILSDVLEEKDEAVKNALTEIEKYKRAKYLRMDVSNFEDTNRVAKAVLEEFGKLDILVNNAGVNRDRLLKDISKEDWDMVINVDLTGVFNVTKAFIDHMVSRQSGVIINISSIVGLDGNVGQSNYSAAKAGVATFTYTIGKELARYNIRAVAVAPGFIKTRMTASIPDKLRERFTKGIPMRRFGEPKEIAKVVRFLASDEASYITATVVRIDGGYHL
jgi:NAD(P)-dependent dehydrogenase (short-subunit alcohol dehydrogenase family)